MRVLLFAVLSAGLMGAPVAASEQPATEPCASLVTTLAPQLVFRRPLRQLRRVEIRACGLGQSENLQIVAWEDGSQKPALVHETYDYTITQLFMRHNIFVIETARDAYDTVAVILYEKGKPRLALQETVRDPAMVQVDGNEVRITVTPNRGAPKSYRYNLSPR